MATQTITTTETTNQTIKITNNKSIHMKSEPTNSNESDVTDSTNTETGSYQGIIQAIDDHAQPTPFDWLTLAVSVIAIGLTIIIYKTQTKIMKDQTAISQQQTSISEKQTEIMEEQNKIALFDKKLDIYRKCKEYIDSIKCEVSAIDKILELNKGHRKHYSNNFVGELKLLFSNNIVDLFDEICKYIQNRNTINNYISEYFELLDEDKKCDLRDILVKEEYYSSGYELYDYCYDDYLKELKEFSYANEIDSVDPYPELTGEYGRILNYYSMDQEIIKLTRTIKNKYEEFKIAIEKEISLIK